MKKSVLTAFITVVCATSSVMAADDNAITDGSVTFNGKVIAPACTLVAATKDSVVTLPDVSATKLQTNGQVSDIAPRSCHDDFHGSGNPRPRLV